MALKTLQRIRGFTDDATQRAFESVYSVVDETVKTLNNTVNMQTSTAAFKMPVTVSGSVTSTGSIYAGGGYKYIVGPFYFGGAAFSTSQTNTLCKTPQWAGGTSVTASPIEWDALVPGSIVGLYAGAITASVTTGTIQFSLTKNGSVIIAGNALNPSANSSVQNFTRGTYTYGARTNGGGGDYLQLVYTTNGSYASTGSFGVYFVVQDT